MKQTNKENSLDPTGLQFNPLGPEALTCPAF